MANLLKSSAAKSGKTYGYLRIISEEAPCIRHNKAFRMVKRQCVCGDVRTVYLNSLTRKDGIKSCGCQSRSTKGVPRPISPRVLLIGKKFERLTVVKELPRKVKYRRLFLCLCDCGITKEVMMTSLRSGDTKSCGCLKQERAKSMGLAWGKLRKPSEEKKRLQHFAIGLRTYLRRAIRKVGSSKAGRHTFDLLGYSKEDVYNHLSGFLGKGCVDGRVCHGEIIISIDGSHIDHYFPVSVAKSEQDVIKLFQLKNLRLICWKCNLSKSDKISGLI